MCKRKVKKGRYIHESLSLRDKFISVGVYPQTILDYFLFVL